jgi:hypothetical protein
MCHRAKRAFLPSISDELEDRVVPSHSGLFPWIPVHIIAGPIPAEAAVPTLSGSTYRSVMAQIDAAFDAHQHGVHGNRPDLMRRLSAAVLRLPYGATLWATIRIDPASITASNTQSVRKQVKSDVRNFVHDNLREGRIVLQSPGGATIHQLSPTGHTLPLPRSLGPVSANPPVSMTPFQS